MYDIIIVGGGPAGLTAAIYGRRNLKTVLVIEKSVFGGQIVNSPKVENIPGFESISGDEFGDKLLEQAMGQGAEVAMENVTGVEKTSEGFSVFTEDGNTFEGKTVILATGTTHRTLGLPGEENLIGSSISFCAVCDGEFYRDKTVVMVGGGNSAFVESAMLVGIVSKLIILQDMPVFTADQKLQDQVLPSEKVEAHTGTKVLAYEKVRWCVPRCRTHPGQQCFCRICGSGQQRILRSGEYREYEDPGSLRRRRLLQQDAPSGNDSMLRRCICGDPCMRLYQ